MALPLLERVSEHDITFFLTPVTRARRAPTRGLDLRDPANRFPSRSPGQGEQYRFHVDMRTCIGCKCCVVACNEQNGNPPAINWRRVGEVEAGWYPRVQRSFVSMGCNHCLDPACLTGCPVDAYNKDPATGIVRHDAETCIGCQYCTWNCSYGVPQYNPERGVVGKCDLCHGRLSLGQAPACVGACPTSAIQIEIVDVNEWRRTTSAATPLTGLPSADHSLSTTRLTLPAGLTPDATPVDRVHLSPEDPHWPLVVMTILTQLSVGTFATIWLLQLLGITARLNVAAVASLVTGVLALGASTLHLGRPIHAYRALKMWRRSWLSREVLLFTAFSAVAAMYAGLLWSGARGSAAVGAATVLIGFAGVTASAYIYRVTSRPSWNTPFTLAQFVLSAAVLGPLAAAAVGAGHPRGLAVAAALAAGAQLVAFTVRFLQLSASSTVELQSSARLLATTLRGRVVCRGVSLALGAIALPLYSSSLPALAAGGLVALAGEILGRHVFFVAAVAKHMTAPYLGSEAA